METIAKPNTKARTMTGNDIRETIRETCETCGCPELASRIALDISNRYSSSGAKAIGKYSFARQEYEYKIVFAAKIFPYFTPEKRKNVVIHEACHIVDYYYNVRPNSSYKGGHGPTWQHYMQLCGLNPQEEQYWKPEDCGVGFEYKKRKVTRVLAQCSCRTMEITKNRATKMEKGRRYICCLCRTNISVVRDNITSP